MQHILVLGGGAAGLAAALAAAQTAKGSARITVLDRNAKVGKKLLATGNGRCNLDNRDISPERYFTSSPKALRCLLDAVNEGTNITVVISDNLTTGMTGGQDSAGTGRLEQICAGLGVDPAHIRVVVPLPRTREEMKAMLREEIAYDGVSVIIPRRECIQTAKRHNATKQKQ